MQQIVDQINVLGREALIDALLEFRGRVRLDFTRRYLASLSDERLRHLLLAARMQWLAPAESSGTR